MAEGAASGLAGSLIETWQAQARDGFLLLDPEDHQIEVKSSTDPDTAVPYRFRWLPHRELRSNIPELERRRILNPARDERRLFRDPRDPSGRHCFLCIENIRECHPRELLIELNLADRTFYAGANYAWVGQNHFTVISGQHENQEYASDILGAMLDLHRATGGTFRVLFHGQGVGATIPWHLHLQITTEALPIEELSPAAEGAYPLAVHRFHPLRTGGDDVSTAVASWSAADHKNHGVNIIVAGSTTDPNVFVVPRDRRRAVASNKGLIGGFEVAGDFIYSEPSMREQFESATYHTAREALRQVRPVAPV